MTPGEGRHLPGRLPGAAMLPPASPPAGERRPSGRKWTRGRFAEVNGFIDFTLASLTPAEAKVWLILWRDTKPDGLARTGQSDIARRAGVTDRMVRYAVAGLIDKGLVRRVRRGRLGAGPSVYRVRGVNPRRQE